MDHEVIQKLAWALDNLWIHCDRHVIGVTDDGLFGAVLAAPDCIIFSLSLTPVPMHGCFYDHCLN